MKQADPQRKLIILSYVGVWTKVQAHRFPSLFLVCHRSKYAGDPGWASCACCVAQQGQILDVDTSAGVECCHTLALGSFDGKQTFWPSDLPGLVCRLLFQL